MREWSASRSRTISATVFGPESRTYRSPYPDTQFLPGMPLQFWLVGTVAALHAVSLRRPQRSRMPYRGRRRRRGRA